MDSGCKIRTRSELDRILENHVRWLRKYSSVSLVFNPGDPFPELPRAMARDPLRADLADAHLENADLIASRLSMARLDGADLSGAHLGGAMLSGADLTSVKLNGSDLSGAELAGADLTRAEFRDADLSGADLFGADLTEADFEHVYLNHARLLFAHASYGMFYFADLTEADFSEADLTGSRFYSADLSEAIFSGTDLSWTDLTGAIVWETDFEPNELPPAYSIARVRGLRTLRWHDEFRPFLDVTQNPTVPAVWKYFKGHYHLLLSSLRHGGDSRLGGMSELQYQQMVEEDSLFRRNPYPILDMRKALHDAGYGAAENEVNLAYRRGVESPWQIFIFDWTCEWGANWIRPLKIVGWLGLFCSVLYWALLRCTRSNRLWVVGRVGKRDRQWRVGQGSNAPEWLRVRRLPAWRFGQAPWRRLIYWRRAVRALIARIPLLARVRWEFRLYRTAALFSIMSVLNLGVQGLDLGRWIRLMQRRDFDLKARGYIRLLAGIQSVLSFALLALAALSYLGHPFE
jgi:hypothetical protein